MVKRMSRMVSDEFGMGRQTCSQSPTGMPAIWLAELQNHRDSHIGSPNHGSVTMDDTWHDLFPSLRSPQQSNEQTHDEPAQENFVACGAPTINDNCGNSNVEDTEEGHNDVGADGDAEEDTGDNDDADGGLVQNVSIESIELRRGESVASEPPTSSHGAMSSEWLTSSEESCSDASSPETDRSAVSSLGSTPPSACRATFSPARSQTDIVHAPLITDRHKGDFTVSDASSTGLHEANSSNDHQSDMEFNERASCRPSRTPADTNDTSTRAASVRASISDTSETSSKKRGPSSPRQKKGKKGKVSKPRVQTALQLQDVPPHMKQPAALLDEILPELGGKKSLAELVSELFYGVGHSKWFNYLRLACRTIREGPKERFPASDRGFNQTIRVICNSMDNDLVDPIRRRCSMVDLVRHRNAKRKRKRVGPKVLLDMLITACPELKIAEEFERKKALKNLSRALKRGRNWTALAEHFGDGIIPLVPAHPDFGLQNVTVIEDMSAEKFQVLINVMEKYRGGFLHHASQALAGIADLILRKNLDHRYKFEICCDIEDCEPDSEAILDGCKLEAEE